MLSFAGISNLDTTLHCCELAFGTKMTAGKGRKAYELFVTIAEFGLPLEGAAGSIPESLSLLMCIIDPGEVKQRDGGRAD
jgi:hypothetical protein